MWLRTASFILIPSFSSGRGVLHCVLHNLRLSEHGYHNNLCSNRADHIFSLVTIAIEVAISCHAKHGSWLLVQICHMLNHAGSSPYFEFLCFAGAILLPDGVSG